MESSKQDQWAHWLLHRRFGGDSQRLQEMLARLAKVRDHVLKHASIAEGETVLDVGCGDGLIAFGALDLVGEQGKVIFSDISRDLLDHCQELAQQMQILARCRFIQTSATELGDIEDQSVNVVTTRSVLIYVHEKRRAFQQFYRVLKPGGRLSLFEPINRFAYPEPPQRFFGYEVTPVMDLTLKILAVYGCSAANDQGDSMMDFDERDLFNLAEQAGFPEVHLELQTDVIPGTSEQDAVDEQRRWENFLQSAPNPLVPTLEEAIQQALTPEERERLSAHLRPLVEKNRRVDRSSVAYLWAVK